MSVPPDEGNAPEVQQPAPQQAAAGESETTAGEVPNLDRTLIPRRFLAAETSAGAFRPHGPGWFRTFLLAILFGVSCLALLVTLSWLSARPAKTVLLTVAVYDYASPGLPEIPFARQDATRIRDLPVGRAPGRAGLSPAATAHVLTPRDREDFASFFAGSLSQVQVSTALVYVIAHGWSDSRAGYLAPGNARAEEPQSGYPIDDILQAMVECPAQNVFLFLDTNRLDHDLRLGMLGNDFTSHLRQAFAELQQRVANDSRLVKKNLAILCASQEGQVARSSEALQGSPFAVAVQYCLLGGPSADTIDHRTNSPDKSISAVELARYVQSAVDRWSLSNRGVHQSPLFLHLGGDFSLADVDPAISLARLTADSAPDVVTSEPDPLATVAKAGDPTTQTKASPADNAQASPGGLTEPAASANAAGGGESPGSNASQTPASPLLDRTRPVLIRIVAMWDQQQQLASSAAAGRLPFHWAAVAEALQRAEARLLADSPAQATQILDDEAEPLFSALQSAASEDRSKQPDPDSLPDRAAVDKALAEPTAANLDALEKNTLVEAELLRVLARFCRSDDHWTDPQLVQLAIRTRTLAQQAGEVDQPNVLEFIRAEVEAGDRARRQAEDALINGNLDPATRGFRSATASYLQASADADQAAKALRQVQTAALTAPAMVAWLGSAPAWNSQKTRRLRLLDQFYHELNAFSKMADQTSLLKLGKRAAEIREQAVQAAIDALQPTGWRRDTAVLQLTSLPAGLRQQILKRLLNARDSVALDGPASRYPAHVANERPGNPFGVFALLDFLNDASDPSLLTGRQLDRFQALDPDAPSAATSQRAGVAGDVTFETRAAATQDFRDVIQRIRRQPVFSARRTTVWQKQLANLTTAYWLGAAGLNLAARDANMAELAEQSRQQFLIWRLTRLDADSRALPGDVYRKAVNQLVAEVKKHDPAFSTPTQTNWVQLVGVENLNLDKLGNVAQGPIAVPLRVRVLRNFPAQTTAKLILEWPLAEANFQVQVDGVTQQGGRAEYPLPTAQGEYAIPLAISAGTRGEVPGRLPITARASFAFPPGSSPDHDTQWLPLQIHRRPPTPKPAEIVLAWEDHGITPGRIDLYPNQSLPLQLFVKKNAVGPLDLRVELQGSGAVETLPIAIKPEETGQIPIVPAAEIHVPLADALTLRLFNGDSLLDERTLDVAVLDLNQCFRHDVAYDPFARQVKAIVQRAQHSDSSAPVAIELQLPDIPAAQGILLGELSATKSIGALAADVPLEALPPFRTAISVAHVPRVFRDLAGPAQLGGAEDEQLHLRVLAPVSGATAAYSGEAVSMPLQVQLDGPGRISFSAGIDRNQNGLLDGSEQQFGGQFWRGKNLQLEFVTAVKPPGFTVRSQLQDIALPLDMTGLVGAQTVIAQAVSGTQVADAVIQIYVLKTAPGVRITAPSAGAPVGAGQPLELGLVGDAKQFPAIENVEFGFDKNANGQLDEDELVAPVGIAKGEVVRFKKSPALTVFLPTQDLPAGPLTVLARAVSSVPDPTAKDGKKQLRSVTDSRELLLSTTGRIVGRVTTPDGLPQQGAVVSVVGVGRKLTDDQGQFAFPVVPAGQYAVLAEADDRAAKAVVNVKAAQATNVGLTIRIH